MPDEQVQTQTEGTAASTQTVAEEQAGKPFDARTDLEKLTPETRAYIERLRSESAERRREAQQYKTLNEKLESEKRNAHEAKLKEQGEYKTLLETKEKEFSEKINKLQDKFKMQEVKIALQQEGAIDPDVAKLADLGSVIIGDDGEVRGVEDAVKALKSSKPHLFTKAAPAPAADTTTTTTTTQATSTSAGGQAPGAGSTPGQQTKRVTDMSKDDYLKSLQALKQGLRRS